MAVVMPLLILVAAGLTALGWAKVAGKERASSVVPICSLVGMGLAAISLGWTMTAFSRGAPLEIALSVGSLRFALAFDYLGIFWAVIVLQLGILAGLALLGQQENSDAEFWGILWMVGGSLGLAVAYDLVTLWLFGELGLVLTLRGDSPQRQRGNRLILLTSGILALAGLALLGQQAGRVDFSSLSVGIFQASPVVVAIALVLFAIAVGIKVSIPLRRIQAAEFRGVGLNLPLTSSLAVGSALYALARVLMLAGETSADFGLALAILGAILALAGGILALIQVQLWPLLAWSALGQTGFVIFGFGLGWHYQVLSGLQGGLYHLLIYAATTLLILLSVKRLIGEDEPSFATLRGKGRQMPVLGGCLVVAILAWIGLPPTGGFVSKVLIYQAGLDTNQVFGYLASVVTMLASLAYLAAYARLLLSLFSSESKSSRTRTDASSTFLSVSLVILAGIILLLGIWPQVGLQMVQAAAYTLKGAILP